ncbi:hypothetical protein [Limnothrix redekei]|uniref:Uncharacterized protein n=1 Tax=Limnothrix redekei LRLZ20PSL1 TaxID=3112953 RepID=A0ABW7CCL8_9CYAN
MQGLTGFLAVSVVNYVIGLLVAWLRRLVHHPSFHPLVGAIFDVLDPYVTGFVLIAILAVVNGSLLKRFGLWGLGAISISIWGFFLAWMANQVSDYHAWLAIQSPKAPDVLKTPLSWWSQSGEKEVIGWHNRRTGDSVPMPLWVARSLQLAIGSLAVGFSSTSNDD